MHLINIKKLLHKILIEEKIKEKYIIIHASLIPLGVLSITDVKDFWNIFEKLNNKKFTIIMPSFSFNIGRKKRWDYRKTKSEMGLLSEYFRKNIAYKRTIHPFHSISYAGKLAKEIPDHNSSSSFGNNSVWEWLCKRKDVLNLSIGMGLGGGATFVHYAEELSLVQYREFIDLKNDVFDHNGKKINKKFTFFARKKVNKIDAINDWNKVEKDLIKKKILKKKKYKNIVYSKMNTYLTTKYLIKQLKENKFYMGNFDKIIN